MEVMRVKSQNLTLGAGDTGLYNYYLKTRSLGRLPETAPVGRLGS